MGVGGQRKAQAALPPGMTRYPLYRRLGGPRGGLDGCRKSRPHTDSIPGWPNSSQFAILTTLARPTFIFLIGIRANDMKVFNTLNEDITKCLDAYCNTNLYVRTTVFITQGTM